ncbi:MAG: metalloregulator ArsR/SmtB family transcription factor [candidate division Zixibacteria bacterium]|nr:metalloregulator ArsR/SmtB family transcription factor [candidate division Zixibacteria bacterium]
MRPKKEKPSRLKPRRARAVRAENEELAQLAKALGHPARASIMRLLLTGGECICGGIVERLPLAQATVSQHLKVLKEAGWIAGEVDGPRVCYCARPGTLQRFVALAWGLAPANERKEERSKS